MQQTMSRRSFLRLAAGTTALATVVACTLVGQPAGAGGAAAPAAETGTINLWRFTGPIWEAVIEAFDGQHENVQVNLMEIGVFYLSAAPILHDHPP